MFGAVVRITWNQNTENDLEGYRVFCGTSSAGYEHVINVGDRTAVDISGLQAGVTYHFAVSAYDRHGNESENSPDSSITIPTDLASMLSTVVHWFEGVVGDVFGLEPEVALYALSDFGDAEEEYRPNPSGAIAAKDFFIDEPAGGFVLNEEWPVRDTILLSLAPFQLSAFYPEGSFFFYPLSEDCPVIEGDILYAEYPGCFLYMVYDETGTMSHVLRLSVAEDIFSYTMYDPARTLYLEDLQTGLAVDLPESATSDTKPIALGWGGDEVYAGSVIMAEKEEAVFFDILPFDLELQEPMLVTLPIDIADPHVARFDEETGTWVFIDDVQVEGGFITFSTQTLGRFKVSNVSPETGEVSESEAYEGSDKGCFIGSCRPR